MLKLAIILLIISLVAGLFGFTGISKATGGLAKIIFVICLIGFIIVLLAGLLMGSIIF